MFLLRAGGDVAAATGPEVATTGSVVINEIMYNERRRGAKEEEVEALRAAGDVAAVEDAEGETARARGGDWVELLNAGDVPVDVTGWTFRGSRDKGSGKKTKEADDDGFSRTTEDEKEEGDVFEIPPFASKKTAVVIPAGGFLILARNATAFAASHPEMMAASPDALVNGSFGFNLSPKG